MRNRLSTTPVPAIHRPLPARSLWLLAALAGCVLAVSGCGTSGGISSRAGNGEADFLAFSKCMRSHGVPEYPDPSGGGGAINLSPGSNINPFSPAVKDAQAECQKLLPGGGPRPGVSEQQREQLVRSSECMRAHGVPDFPDPTNVPPTNPQDYSSVTGIGGQKGGVWVLVPKTIDVNSPAFRRASNACAFR